MTRQALARADTDTSGDTDARPSSVAVTGRSEARRHWTGEQKRRVVGDSMARGAPISAIARRHAITRGQLYS